MKKAQQLTMCLRGAAQKILSDLTLGQLSNYDSLKNILSQRFNPRESEIAYRCEFRNWKRLKDETVAEYGYNLRRLAQKAYPTLRYHEIEPTVVDQYIHGLNNHELKKHVQFHHPQTLNQALAFASEYEAFLGPVDKIVKPREESDMYSLQTLQPSTDRSHSSESQILNQISNMIDAKFKEYFKGNRMGGPSRNVNQGYSEPNRNVGSGLNDTQRGSVIPNRFDKPREITCYNCYEIGHIKSRCPYLREKPENHFEPRQGHSTGGQPLN